MYKVIGNAHELTNEQWKALRVIGGSTVGAILGHNHFKSPFQVWHEFVTGEFEDVDNKHTRFGKLLEPVIREWFANEIKNDLGREITVRENPNVMQSEEFDFLTGNIDGDIDDPEEGLGVLEVKTASAYAQGFVDGEIPDSYYCQLQYYLWLTDRQYGYMVWLKDKDMDYIRVNRNDFFIENMLEMVVDFWVNHIVAEIPPEMNGQKTEEEYIRDTYRVSSADKLVELPELEPSLLKILELRQEIKDKQAEEKAITNEIKFVMGDAEVALVGDKRITWKPNKNGERRFKI